MSGVTVPALSPVGLAVGESLNLTGTLQAVGITSTAGLIATAGSLADASLSTRAAEGLCLVAKAGSINDFTLYRPGVAAEILKVLTGSAILTIVGGLAIQSAAIENVKGGTYTPTLTNAANIAASQAYVSPYLRVGDAVITAGKVDMDPTAATTLTQLGISLPVASNLGANNNLGGVAATPSISGAGGVAAIGGDATNDRAVLQFITGTDVANYSWFYLFMYQAI